MNTPKQNKRQLERDLLLSGKYKQQVVHPKKQYRRAKSRLELKQELETLDATRTTSEDS